MVFGSFSGLERVSYTKYDQLIIVNCESVPCERTSNVRVTVGLRAYRIAC